MYQYKECAYSFVTGCKDPPDGSLEVFICARPDRKDAYGKLMCLIWEKFPNHWFRVPACRGHLQELIQRADELMHGPELWRPGSGHPDILAREGQRFVQNGAKLEA
jgi:hypothetical protein